MTLIALIAIGGFVLACVACVQIDKMNQRQDVTDNVVFDKQREEDRIKYQQDVVQLKKDLEKLQKGV